MAELAMIANTSMVMFEPPNLSEKMPPMGRISAPTSGPIQA